MKSRRIPSSAATEWRKHVAWGVSPRVDGNYTREPRRGESRTAITHVAAAPPGLSGGLPHFSPGWRPGLHAAVPTGLKTIISLLLLAFTNLWFVSAEPTPSSFTTGRLGITLGDNALPAQLAIQAAPTDLPLENRAQGADPLTPLQLTSIGRGPQLFSPMRLEANVKGTVTELKSEGPSPIENEKNNYYSRATLTGGGVTAKVDVTYTPGGRILFKIAYGGGDVESLSFIVQLQGITDTIIEGRAPFAATDYTLADDEGILWGNAKPQGEANDESSLTRGKPGVPSHVFFGSGDRGFTFLSDSADGWTVTPVAPVITLSRDKIGNVTFRAQLVNHPTKIAGEKTASFTLLVHPTKSPAADNRKTTWLTWPYKKPTPADRATEEEWLAESILLQGNAGGDAKSAEATLADTYPLPLFRYLAGTHTGLPARLITNSPGLSTPGRVPALDRMAIGRALLHDIGFDPKGAVHLASLGRLVSGLAEFGYFETDGQTEFIPYWRSGSVLRYGEVFDKNDAFQETTTDPMERVHVSAWRRPGKALILIVNESNKPVREQLYVLNAKRLFGSRNSITRPQIVDLWDMSLIPEDSDWSFEKLLREGINTTEKGAQGRPADNVPFLMDAEDRGGVAQSVAVKDQEVYLRVFVPARGLRLLVGGSMK
ncbi:MAG: hypothetical protein O3B01_24210 [Planctomycetota bacterium]|nr:hypothetical protein [Planctomycetota bacterium]